MALCMRINCCQQTESLVEAEIKPQSSGSCGNQLQLLAVK